MFRKQCIVSLSRVNRRGPGMLKARRRMAEKDQTESPAAEPAPAKAPAPAAEEKRPKEIGGRGGLEPTRYGDWEINGRCVDF